MASMLLSLLVMLCVVCSLQGDTESKRSRTEEILHSLMIQIGEMMEMYTSLDGRLHGQEDKLNLIINRLDGIEDRLNQRDASEHKLDQVVTLLSDMGGQIVQVESHLDRQDRAAGILSDRLGQQTEDLRSIVTKLHKQDSALDELKPPYGYQARRVFHYQSELGTYKLTFNDAKALCESKGMKIATKEQLQTALNLGMATCACGWVDERTIHYPYIWPQSGCGGDTTPTSLRSCGQTRSNVYCFR